MKYIYGLYNQNSLNKLRYIGQTDSTAPRRPSRARLVTLLAGPQ